MNSIRERILQALLEVLRPVVTAQGATLHRSPTVAISREHCPALVVFAESETIAERANDRVTRELIVKVIALARAIPPVDPETEADRLIAAAHAALFQNVNLGGLCLGIRELDSDFEVEDADAVAAAIPARYQIGYRTLANDLSIQG